MHRSDASEDGLLDEVDKASAAYRAARDDVVSAASLWKKSCDAKDTKEAAYWITELTRRLERKEAAAEEFELAHAAWSESWQRDRCLPPPPRTPNMKPKRKPKPRRGKKRR